MDNFTISSIPELIFGTGTLSGLPGIITTRGFKNIAVITGGSSFTNTVYWKDLSDSLNSSDIRYCHYRSTGETDPEKVDEIVYNLKNYEIDAVVAIGGGTAMDTGKAVAAMLCMEGSIVDYLEGIGTKNPTGKRKPLICIPTTSGTGSEATKNAVITKTGKKGYKKSLRHEGYIPDTALIDPILIKNCPLSLTVASGMDAVTQLLESYVSYRATPFTDTLALYGLKLAGRSLPKLVKNGDDMEARSEMAYASYLSGVVLANAGLGVVHGAASVLGSMRTIPHGVVCGTLIGSATEVIIKKLQSRRNSENLESLKKYSQASSVLTDSNEKNTDLACNNLIDHLKSWTSKFEIPGLSEYGFSKSELQESTKITGLKNTPCTLNSSDIKKIFFTRL